MSSDERERLIVPDSSPGRTLSTKDVATLQNDLRLLAGEFSKPPKKVKKEQFEKNDEYI